MTVVDQLAFSKNALNQYVKKIEKLIESEVANEESFYADFRDLLKNFFKTEEFEVIVVPKTEGKRDKPDFIVYMDNIPIIHVEGKNPYDPVDKWLLADTTNRLFDQVYRFRGREDNNIPVMVTDFISIWVIDKNSPNLKESNHQIKTKFKIIDDSGTSWKTYSGIKLKFESALNYVCEEIVISISKVSSMIPHLVKYAKKLKEEIIEVFKDPSNPMKNYLENIRDDFLESIFSSDKEKKSQEFADLFAQTLIYGGFVAWMRFCKEGNSPNDFSFRKATDYLPYGSFIYSIFADMSTKSSPDIRKNVFEKIERIFQSTQFEKISQNTETLMITFYSDFIKQYDSEMAKRRGIVYTPYPIVNFIVRGIDYFLKENFKKSEGVASSNITYLDPAAGTMAFPCEILRIAKKFFEKKFSKQSGRKDAHFKEWVKESYLKNTYAFEILMAPYVLGHFRTNMLLEELGVKIDPSKDRVKLYLFNTLMELQTTLHDFRNPAIGQEIVSALNVRNNKEILIVLSNPPYNISSQNKFSWIENKLDYNVKDLKIKNTEKIKLIKKEKNDYVWDLQREGTKEIKNLKPLHDDYVKFIRFAQWKVKKNGHGIIAYITNNFYIDGLVFRGMRSSLQRDFDQIWIINLNGDARKLIPPHISETGIKVDKNVFDIKVGVSITFFIRLKNHSEDKCEINYTEIYGTKDEKFAFLEKNIKDMKFKSIPKRMDYGFSPDEFKLREHYAKFIYLLDIFKKNIVGIISKQDPFISDIDKNVLIEKLKSFFANKTGENLGLKNIQQGNYWWKPKVVKTKTDLEESIGKIILWNYRGFDKRYICYNNYLLARTSYRLMQYLIPPNNNITLIINRLSRGCKGDSSVFISDTIFEHSCNEGPSGQDSYVFPLRINESPEAYNYSIPKIANDSNFRKEFFELLTYGKEISDELVFYYIYGILFSPSYRDLYFLGLKEDFPRIPFPDNKENFINMANFGKKLAKLHLFKSKELDTTKFPMGSSTDYRIYNIKRNDKDMNGIQIPDTYDPDTEKIYFKKRTKAQIEAENKRNVLDEITWIGGITQKMWDFEIGGRQQLKEWLYARRYSEEIKKNTIQRPLNNEELDYFLKMCDVIKKTIELLPELDKIYKKIDP